VAGSIIRIHLPPAASQFLTPAALCYRCEDLQLLTRNHTFVMARLDFCLVDGCCRDLCWNLTTQSPVG
jgi:hypothetical protein